MNSDGSVIAAGVPIVVGGLAVLVALTFSKHIYLSSLTSYYTFYLITKFGVSVQTAQVRLFVFLVSVAVGTVLGGLPQDLKFKGEETWVEIGDVLHLVGPQARLGEVAAALGGKAPERVIHAGGGRLVNIVVRG